MLSEEIDQSDDQLLNHYMQTTFKLQSGEDDSLGKLLSKGFVTIKNNRIISDELKEIIQTCESSDQNLSNLWNEMILPKIKYRAQNGFRNIVIKISEIDSEYNKNRLREYISLTADSKGYIVSKYEPLETITIKW